MSIERAQAIIEKIPYATLATVSEQGEPWNSPVWSMHEGFTFYWCSWKENQHSKNIRANGKVFIVVYDSTAPEGTGEGVYIHAKAEEINDEWEIKRILNLRTKMKPSKRGAIEFMGDYPRRWYKATPVKMWMNEDSEIDGNFVDVRKEVPLP